MPDAEIQEILVEIEEKKKKADELALGFRRLYQESQQAYADGDGELAKELSEEGHKAQDECEVLNEEVADLYKELRDLRRQVAEVIELPQMFLKGIPPSFQKAINDAFELLPENHVSGELIDRISYSDRYIILDPAKGIPQQAKTVFPQIESKPYIVINRQTPNGQFVSIKNIQNAIAHEVGHVVYRKVLTNDQRNDWFEVMNEVYAPLDDPEADAEANEAEFASVYSSYFLDEDNLKKYFPEEVDFFEEFDF